MRKLTLLIVAIFGSLMLSGCSLLGEVNNTLEYANEATDHINTLSTFAEQAPQMIQDAALDANVKQDLENQLNNLIVEIEAFNNVEAPKIAEDIHQQLVSKNNVIIEEINTVLESGKIETLENTQIFNTINEVTTLLNQIEQLGL